MDDRIKISELNEFPINEDPLQGEDFLPMVNSSSMTTYRIGVEELGEAITAMNPPPTEALWADHAESASFASQSLTASLADYAKVAGNVNTTGSIHYYTKWTKHKEPGPNGCLSVDSGLYHSHSYEGTPSNEPPVEFKRPGSSIVIVGSFNPNDVSNTKREDFKSYGYWNYRQNFPKGVPRGTARGLFTEHPIVSPWGALTDQSTWIFVTGSYPLVDPETNKVSVEDEWLLERPDCQTYYWSGSSDTENVIGSGMYEIGREPNAIANAFNGKWVRIAAISNREPVVSDHSAYGEAYTPWGGFFGRVRIELTTDNTGTNISHVVDMDIHSGPHSGGDSVRVLHSSIYNGMLIRKLRLSRWTNILDVPPSEYTYTDPAKSLDIFVDNLDERDNYLRITLQSWGGVRFLRQPNIGPPPLYDTGSANLNPPPNMCSYLIFPANPGYYSTLGDKQGDARQGMGAQPYMFLGKKIIMDPNRNLITESGWKNDEPIETYKPYSLWVSGTISTHKYYAEDDEGKSGQMLTYDPIQSQWRLWTAKGGILINSASSVDSPMELTPKDTVAVGTIMAYAGTTAPLNWLECDGQVLETKSYYDLYDAIKVPPGRNSNAWYGYLCDKNGNRTLSGKYFKLPDLRGFFLRGLNTTTVGDIYRDENRPFASGQSASLGNHYHGVGNFVDGTGNTNDFYLISRSWVSTTNVYTGRYVPIKSNTWGGRQLQQGTSIGGNYDYKSWPIATAHPEAFNGQLYPRNVAMMYIIKYSSAVDYANANTPLQGDVGGTINSSVVTKLRGKSISTTAPTDDQVLMYNAGSAQWEPKNLPNIGAAVGNGKSYIVANPGGAFVSHDGTYLYVFTHDELRKKTNLTRIHMVTNEVKFITSLDLDTNILSRDIGCKLYKVTYDNTNPYKVLYTRYDGFYQLNLHDHSIEKIHDLEDLSRQLPCSHSVDGSNKIDRTWFLNLTYGVATDVGTFPRTKYTSIYYSAGAWIKNENVPSIDFAKFTNNDDNIEFKQFYNSFPELEPDDDDGSRSYVFGFDYNIITHKYYLIDNTYGYLHIFNNSKDNFVEGWVNDKFTYEKTLAIPNVGSGDWSTDRKEEKYVIDINPDTGDERGIIYYRSANTGSHGVVGYVNWPGT